MKYSSIAHNPFSEHINRQLQKLVDKRMFHDSVLLQFLPIDDLRQDINQDLARYDLKIEHVLLFYRPTGSPIDTHVDSAADGCVWNCSLVLPWVCDSGYSVYWEDGDFDLVLESPEEYRGVKYLTIKWNSEHQVCHEDKVNTPIVVRTHVPHGTYSVDSRLLLATVRFVGNPSFEELSEKFAVE